MVPQPIFDVIGVTGLEAFGPHRPGTRLIFGVEQRLPRVAIGRAIGNPGKLVPTVVVIIVEPIGQRRPDHRVDRIGDGAELGFALAQRDDRGGTLDRVPGRLGHRLDQRDLFRTPCPRLRLIGVEAADPRATAHQRHADRSGGITRQIGPCEARIIGRVIADQRQPLPIDGVGRVHRETLRPFERAQLAVRDARAELDGVQIGDAIEADPIDAQPLGNGARAEPHDRLGRIQRTLAPGKVEQKGLILRRGLQVGGGPARGLLRLAPFGDLENDAGKAHRATFGIVAAAALCGHPAHPPVRVDQPILARKRVAAADRLTDSGAQAFDIFRVNMAEERHARLALFGQRGIDAVQPRQPRIGAQLIRDQIPVPNPDDIGCLQRQLKPFLALTQPRLGNHSLGDVIRFDEDRGGRAGGVLDRLKHEIDHAGLVDPVARQQHGLGAGAIGSTGREHLVQQIDEPLFDDLGQRLRNGFADQLGASGQHMIGRVGQCEDMLRPLQQCHCTRGLLEQFAQPFDLGAAFALRQDRCGRLIPLIENAADLAMLVADRGKAVIPIGFTRHPAPFHVEPLVVRGKALARRNHLFELRAHHVPDFGPDLCPWPA